MHEGIYTVTVLDKQIDVEVTEYVPIHTEEYWKEPEDIQYEARTNNKLLNYFLDSIVFEEFDESICKQLSETIHENRI